MIDLLVPGLLILLVLVVTFSAYRMVHLRGGMTSYREAQRLLEKKHLTASEVRRLNSLRRRAVRSWGRTMDPALPPMERLRGVGQRDRWIVQKLNGTEESRHLEAFAELVLWFLQKYEKGYSNQQFRDEVVLPFARGIAGAEYRRLVTVGVGDETATRRSQALAAEVMRRFLAASDNGDGTWSMIEPAVDAVVRA